MKIKKSLRYLALLLAVLLLSACGGGGGGGQVKPSPDIIIAPPLAQSPPITAQPLTPTNPPSENNPPPNQGDAGENAPLPPPNLPPPNLPPPNQGDAGKNAPLAPPKQDDVEEKEPPDAEEKNLPPNQGDAGENAPLAPPNLPPPNQGNAGKKTPLAPLAPLNQGDEPPDAEEKNLPPNQGGAGEKTPLAPLAPLNQGDEPPDAEEKNLPPNQGGAGEKTPPPLISDDKTPLDTTENKQISTPITHRKRHTSFTGKGVTVGIVDNTSFWDSQYHGFGDRLKAPNETEEERKTQGNRHGFAMAFIIGGVTLNIAPQIKMSGVFSELKLEEMYTKGIRITNHSYHNHQYRSVNFQHALEKADFLQPYVDQDGLLLWATGNMTNLDTDSPIIKAQKTEDRENATYYAALPHLYTELETGWLAVTGTSAIITKQTKDFVQEKIADYAYRCGVAANWCLAAPTIAYYPKDIRGILRDGTTTGTSNATAFTTSISALVKEAYPWMKGTHLRQTLLSTANRKHNQNSKPEDPRYNNDHVGPDKTYGWGIVDPDKAVEGPSLFMKRLTLAVREQKGRKIKIDNEKITRDAQGTEYLKHQGMQIRIDPEKIIHTDRGRYIYQEGKNKKDPQGQDLYHDFIADFDNQDTYDKKGSTFSNDIAGDAGLIKRGGGTLVLSGKNTYRGNNTIYQGTLEINGSVASDVAIEKEGTLSGIGSIGGHVNNAGTLINGSIDGIFFTEIEGDNTVRFKGLTIEGDYTISPQAKHVSGMWDKPLQIEGKAILNNQAYLILTQKAHVPATGRKHTVLTAKEVIGQFAPEVDIKDMLLIKGTPDYSDPTKVNVTLTRQKVDEVAQKRLANHASHLETARSIEHTLQALDQQVAQGQASAALLRDATAFQRAADVTTLAHSLDSLSGQLYASAQALTFQQSRLVNQALSDRVDQAQNTSGVWVSGIGASGKLSDSGYASANTSLWGSQLGLDWAITPKTLLGAAWVYADGRAHFDRFGGTAKSHHAGLSVYGRTHYDNGTYLAARLGMARVKSQVEREILLGNHQTQSASAEHKDRVLSGYVEAGHAIAWADNYQLTPFVGLGIDRLHRGAFTEKSTSAFALEAKAKSYQHVASTLGLRASHRFEWAGGKSVWQGYAAWQRALTQKRLDFQATYQGLTAQENTVNGVRLPRNALSAGLGLNTQVSQRWGWFANYQVQFAQGGTMHHGMAAGVKIALD